MRLVYFLFCGYFLILLLFSLFSHPVCYCILLVMNALLSSMLYYIMFGFSCYSLLFCLVYIGGVYILLIFVSVYSPNSNYLTYFNLNNFVVSVGSFGVVTVGVIVIYALLEVEFSFSLCTRNEGAFYVIVCLMLLFGFLVLSMVMSVKVNYYQQIVFSLV